MAIESVLKPGDVLLYAGGSVWSWLIEVKSWSDVSHVETYVGEGKSVASRDGKGVNTYDLRVDGLKYILRPIVPFDLQKGLDWQQTVSGQGYDWLGLLSFVLRSKDTGSGRKMFCSEHTTRFARACGYEPFAPGYDADKVSPGMFKSSPVYTSIPLPDHPSPDASAPTP